MTTWSADKHMSMIPMMQPWPLPNVFFAGWWFFRFIQLGTLLYKLWMLNQELISTCAWTMQEDTMHEETNHFFILQAHLLQAAAKHGVLSKLSKHNWQVLLHTTITYQLCWEPTCLVHKFAELVWIFTFACCRYFPFFCKLGRPVWQCSYPSCLLACVKSFCCCNCRHVCMCICTW